jgi:hypothetical protein
MIQVFHVTPKHPVSYPNVRTPAHAASVWTGQDPGAYYQLVAQVDTDDLDVAWELTNSIDQCWANHPQAGALPGCRYRSSMVGDLFVRRDKNGVWDFQMVASFGFEQVEFC